MPEITIDSQKSLGDILNEINRILIRLDRYIRKKQDKQIKKFEADCVSLLKSMEPLFKHAANIEKIDNATKGDAVSTDKAKSLDYIKANAVKVFNEILSLCSEKDSSDDKIDKTARAQILFRKRRINIFPVFGDGKKGKAFYNEGLVIGARIAHSNGIAIQYRVDYDPKKLLHINLDLVLAGKTFRFAINVKPENVYYNISEPKEKNAKEKKLELTKYKFFTKTTLYYLLERDKLGANKQKNNGEPDELHIINFFQGKDYDLESVKKLILDSYSIYYSDGNTVEKFNKCTTGMESMKVLLDSKELRHAVIACVTNAFSNNGIRLSEPNAADSEAPPEIDSETLMGLNKKNPIEEKKEEKKDEESHQNNSRKTNTKTQSSLFLSLFGSKNQQDQEKQLRIAAGYNKIGNLKKLITDGVDIDAIGKSTGATALHFAVTGNAIDCARELLRHNARTDIKDKDGKIAIELAKSAEMKELFNTSTTQKDTGSLPICFDYYTAPPRNS